MKKPIILAIETSAENCSVSISVEDSILCALSNNEQKSHAKKLLSTIDNLLKETEISLDELNAIAISEGPGSYTGLRIGVSSAKGLALALGIPIIAINTLYAMSFSVAHTLPDFDLYLPMLDARRLEVYTLLMDNECNIIKETSAEVLTDTSFVDILNTNKVLCFGSGSEKFKNISAHSENINWLSDSYPTSLHLHQIALDKYCKKEFIDTLYFEPFYLKEFHSTSSTN